MAPSRAQFDTLTSSSSFRCEATLDSLDRLGPALNIESWAVPFFDTHEPLRDQHPRRIWRLRIEEAEPERRNLARFLRERESQLAFLPFANSCPTLMTH